MEYDALDPAEKKAREAERRAADLEKKLKEKDEQEANRLKEQELEKAHAEVDEQVSEALKKIGKKATPRLVVRVVDDMIADMTSGSESWDAEKASKRAIKSVHQDIQEFLGGMTAQEAIQVLPPQLLKAIREHEVSQVMDQKSKVRVKPERTEQSQQAPKNRTIVDAFKNIEKRFGR
jgi:hypothetical protein